MLSVEEALALVLSHALPRAAREVDLAAARGLVLAEDVAADIDSPPHDKSIVDGYAILADDLARGQAEFDVLEQITAGMVPTHAVAVGQATQIMTGAPLPAGADAVVMVEQSEVLSNGAERQRVRLTVKSVSQGQNIMRRASSMARGEVILRAGCTLRPIEIGVLAELGKSRVRAVPRPSLAVLATGNELVPAAAVPGPGQIRNSNGPLLLAAGEAAGAEAIDLGVARDEREALGAMIARGLERDVLVISGGVSAGVLDLVPGVLTQLGVKQVFHKVSLKPGKPLWFGVRTAGGRETLVFGLPGNPVSSLVCFELFVRPALGRLAGLENISLVEVTARLARDYVQRGDRLTLHPAQLTTVDDALIVDPLSWRGSGDLRTLVAANALACFPAGQHTYAAGTTIRVLRL